MDWLTWSTNPVIYCFIFIYSFHHLTYEFNIHPLNWTVILICMVYSTKDYILMNILATVIFTIFFYSFIASDSTLSCMPRILWSFRMVVCTTTWKGQFDLSVQELRDALALCYWKPLLNLSSKYNSHGAAFHKPCMLSTVCLEGLRHNEMARNLATIYVAMIIEDGWIRSKTIFRSAMTTE